MHHWTRRYFLQAAGLATAAAQARVSFPLSERGRPTHAYVAVQTDDGQGRVHVLEASGAGWTQIQSVSSVAPSVVLLNEAAQLLIVANAYNQFEGLPTGSVESYRIDPRTRKLGLIRRVGTGLSAVRPHALALSPNGSLLVVAAAAGVYSVLPVSSNGSIGEVIAVRKELVLASEPISSQMHFLDDSRLLVQDKTGLRSYSCGRHGMQLLTAEIQLAEIKDDLPLPCLLQGQRSAAFATFV
jgi:hypothetical protein